jgi:uncharacterized protein (DUF2235 family)
MSKKLIVCCDGTWNTANQERDGVPTPTNVVRISGAMAGQSADGCVQLVYYREGVGTRPWERLWGGAFGVGLSRNILHAYGWLIDHYEPGDQIYLLGFSRGSFTVRSLSGLIRNSGILHTAEKSRMAEAYALYRDREGPDAPSAQAFRAAYAQETRIRFIGVWDTVGELGVPLLGPDWAKPIGRFINRPWTFHDTDLSTRVDAAFQALAVDEERSVFEPTLWHQQPEAGDQVLEQVWFTGVHCNVGGGLADGSLADLALIWMAERARRFGVEFRPGAFEPGKTPPDGVLAVNPDALAPFTTSRVGVYRLTRRHHRPIGQARSEPAGPLDGNETLAPSVRERYAKDDQYRPPELVRYLRTQG